MKNKTDVFQKTMLGLFIFMLALLFINVYFLYKTINKKKERVDATSSYVYYKYTPHIFFKQLEGCMVLFNSDTFKIDKNSLILISSLNPKKISKKERKKILQIIKDIEKAKYIDSNPLKENILKQFYNKNEYILVSGNNFYIQIYKKDKCFIYKIDKNNIFEPMGNNISKIKLFKYCEKGE